MAEYGNYITVAEAVGHLRVDLVNVEDDLPVLGMKIKQAEDGIIDYLKQVDSGWTPETIPPRIKAAMLLLLSALWDDREGQGDAGDYLRDNGPIANLLRRSRDPALA